jgi:localization factor PodJL
MRSGGPWNLRGLRPEARAAAREAARRSGMSVGEWLNTVIQPADENDEEAWWSGEANRAANDPPETRSEYDYPDGKPHRAAASPWRRRERHPDDTPRQAPRYDEPRERARSGSSRRREREPDEFRRSRQRYDDDAGYRDREPPRYWRDHKPEDQQRRERWRREQSRQERQEQSRDKQRQQRRWHEDQWRQAFRGDDRWRDREGDVPRHDREPDEQLRLNFPRDDRGRQPPDPGWQRRERDAHDRHNDPRPVPHEGGAYRDRRGPGSLHRDDEERADRQRLERQLFAQAAANAAAKQSRDDSIDKAVAEITARQQALDGDVAAEIMTRPRERSEAAAPSLGKLPPAPPPPGPEPELERVFAAWPGSWRSRGAAEAPVDISGLEEQLRQMTARIEALRPSSELEKAITGLRTDLADIARSLTEALPRRALESLEIEVKALGQRIDRNRAAGVDASALAGIERGLAEVHQALNALTPAEGLVGFDETVKALGSKIDAVVGKDDPGALPQLEAAINSLRGIASHVASNDTLNKVAEDVRALSAKVDSLAAIGPSTPTLAALENRIDILASALNASAEAGHAVPRELEKLLSSLIEKLERVQLSQTDHAALTHLEDRIAALVKRLDASDARLGTLEGVERGLADLLVYIDQLRDEASLGAKPPPFAASALERGLGYGKQSQRQVQEACEATAAVAEHQSMIEGAAPLEQPKAAAEPMTPSMQAPAPPPLPVDEIDQKDATATAAIVPAPLPRSASPEPAPQPPAATRTPIDPNLPPDHPLEPGSATRSRSAPSAADRIAASEAAAGAKPPVIPDPGGKPDYIAAARRAAQAAAAASPEGRRLARSATEGPAQPKKLTERLRMIAVAAAVVVIVVGGFHIISRLFEDGASNAPAPAQTESPRGQSTPQLRTEPQSQMAPQVQPEPPAQKGPPHVEAEPPRPANSANLPTSVPLPGTESAPNSVIGPDTTPEATPGQQSQLNSVVGPVATGPRVDDGSRAPASSSAVGAPMNITGSLPNASPPDAPPPRSAATANERLPAAIGGPTLRLAALAGDPLAAYEVGVRFSEGRAVPANNEEAARWFDIAAKKGVVPAQFRLATLYEKGLGVKKDLAVARDLYRAAAEKGHGKAMHNLAVLYAEGADGKPDYNTAALWFRKAADHGVTDSQYNLAILYARGVGVEQNLAEAYKWFFLAAKEGDQDAAQKRDQIASRLDAQTRAAARAAAESWTALPQPADAVTIKGNWDTPPAAVPAAPKPKPRSAKAAASDPAKVN